MHNLLVAQSGGPTSAINATLAGVLECAMLSGRVDRIYGGINGIQGILNGTVRRLDEAVHNVMDLCLLSQTPAAALGSCRFKLGAEEAQEEQCRKLVEVFRKYEISYFVYIGGNDSMDTVVKLSDYIKKHEITGIWVVGAPKTIDNDLMETDHCPGFGSAAKYIATTFSQLERDLAVYDSFGVTIVEVMGRNAGWLTAASVLARKNGNRGPDFIYLCERPFSIEQFLEDINSRQDEKRNLLIAVSEGLKDAGGNYISEHTNGNQDDIFGHKDIAGTARVLEETVRRKLGCKVRSVELNLLQRCASDSASHTDLEESRMLGAKAVWCALLGKGGEMAVIERKSSHPYETDFSSVPASLVANHEKQVPDSWMNERGNDVTAEMMEYLSPLVEGEAFMMMKDGLPEYFVLNK